MKTSSVLNKLFTITLLVMFLVMVPLTTAKAAAPIFVQPGGDDTLCDGTVPVDYSPGVAPACAVKTIQKGIDLVDAGGTVVVATGTYAEQVTVAKGLVLTGPFSGVPGSDVSRGTGEAVITFPASPVATDPSEEKAVIYANAANITINGFTLDGANVVDGVGVNGGEDNMIVLNNIVKNFPRVSIWSSSYKYVGGVWDYGYYNSGLLVENNLVICDITDCYTDYMGIYIQGGLGTIRGNVVDDARTGIQIQPYNHPGSTQGLVEGNTIKAFRTPLWFNYSENANSNWLFKDNIVEGIAWPAGLSKDVWDGLRVQTFSAGTVSFEGNTVNIGASDSTDIYMFRKINVTGGSVDLDATYAGNTFERVAAVSNGTNITDDIFYSNIQDAIDAAIAGETVLVGPGTYVEQVTIAKDLSLLGANKASIINAFPSMPVCPTATTRRPIICVQNAVANISGFTIDGLGLGNTNNSFVGIYFRNAGGTVQNNAINDIRDTPFSGGQHGVAIYASNDGVIEYTFNILNNTSTGFQKTGLVFNAGPTTPMVVNIIGNTLTGYGTTTITAQNGIQVWTPAGHGVVDNNTITGIAYDNTASSIKWVATSILNYYTDLDTTDNIITGAQMGIYYSGGFGMIDGNTITVVKAGESGLGIEMADPPSAIPQPIDPPTSTPASYAPSSKTPRLTITVEVSNNIVDFSGVDNIGTVGMQADAGYDTEDMAADVHNNHVDGFDYGLIFSQCDPVLYPTYCTGTVFTSINASYNDLNTNNYGIYLGGPMTIDPTIHHNRIFGDGAVGLYNDLTYSVTAEDNWWGCNEGPTTDGLTDCDTTFGLVDTDPWLVLQATIPTGDYQIGHTYTVDGNLRFNSSGTDTSLIGTLTNWVRALFTELKGLFTPAEKNFTDGLVSSDYVPSTSGAESICVIVDDESICEDRTVLYNYNMPLIVK